MTGPTVRLDAVSKWYGEVLGLNEVSAEFRPGITGLLGPNGAGKSTLLKVICGMLRPSLGRVTVDGRDPFREPGVMRRVGLCPEQDPYYPGIPVWDVVSYLTQLHGFPRAEARDRARRSLERVGLGHVLDRSVATFSKGMRQRAKLAQLLAHDPTVLILDEPLNGLDPPGRREFAKVIREEGAAGKCVIVSSHILHEVEDVARRVLFLHSGRVLADGTVEEIRRELPEHPLTVRVETESGGSLAARLLGLEGVRRVERVALGLEVLTTRAEEFFDRLAELAAEDGVEIRSIVPVDEDLEAVFRYLTR